MADKFDRNDLHVFVGKNTGYYFGKWESLLSGSAGWAGFNWAAFFFSIPWLLYRRLYKILFIFLGLIVVVAMLEEFLFDGLFPPLLATPFFLAMPLLCGFYGNQWYFVHALKKIRDVDQPSPDARWAALDKAGGTNPVGLAVLLSLAVVIKILDSIWS